MGRSIVIHPATSAKATDVASGASGAGRYPNSKRKGGNLNYLGRIIKQQRAGVIERYAVYDTAIVLQEVEKMSYDL